MPSLRYLNALGGGQSFRGKAEKGVESRFSCVVLAGQRSMTQRREALRACKVRVRLRVKVRVVGLGIRL